MDHSKQNAPATSVANTNHVSKNTVVNYGGVIPFPKSENQDTHQLVNRVGAVHDLAGADGTVHWHYFFDDTNIHSLHITIADVRNYANRTWASRKSYAPTGTNSGNWSAFANNHGVTPAWATQLAGHSGEDAAVNAFHANASIAALLRAAYPPPIPNLADQQQFPGLPGR
jgi:hypothetical protein